jgi:hypothetical protein
MPRVSMPASCERIWTVESRSGLGIRHVEGQLDLRGGSIDVLPPQGPHYTGWKWSSARGFQAFQ